MSEILIAAHRELMIQRQKLDDTIRGLEEILGGASQNGNGRLLSAPAPTIDIPAEPERRTRKPKVQEPEPEPARKGRRPQVEDDAVLEFLDRPRKLADIAHKFGINGGTIWSLMHKLVAAGKAVRLGRGEYCRKDSRSTSRAPAPPTPAPDPAAEPEPAKTPPTFQLRRPVSPQTEGIMEFATFKGQQWFHVAELIDWMNKHHPEAVATNSKQTDLRIRVLDLWNNGRLERTGKGAGAFYRRTQPKAGPAEPALVIHVPRDPDVVKH